MWALLTWLGAQPVEVAYVVLGQILSLVYFLYYFLNHIFQYLRDENLD